MRDVPTGDRWGPEDARRMSLVQAIALPPGGTARRDRRGAPDRPTRSYRDRGEPGFRAPGGRAIGGVRRSRRSVRSVAPSPEPMVSSKAAGPRPRFGPRPFSAGDRLAEAARRALDDRPRAERCRRSADPSGAHRPGGRALTPDRRAGRRRPPCVPRPQERDARSERSTTPRAMAMRRPRRRRVPPGR